MAELESNKSNPEEFEDAVEAFVGSKASNTLPCAAFFTTAEDDGTVKGSPLAAVGANTSKTEFFPPPEGFDKEAAAAAGASETDSKLPREIPLLLLPLLGVPMLPAGTNAIEEPGITAEKSNPSSDASIDGGGRVGNAGACACAFTTTLDAEVEATIGLLLGGVEKASSDISELVVVAGA